MSNSEFGLLLDDESTVTNAETSSTGEIEETLTAILAVGDRKVKPDKILSDCTVIIDICEEQIRKFLVANDKQSKAVAITCLKENFEEEILSELSLQCQEEIQQYRYFGLKIGDVLLYPIQVPPEFKTKNAIIEKLLEGTTKVSDLGCDQLKAVVSDLLEMVEYQRHTIELYKGQLKAVKKSLAEVTSEYESCQEKLLEIRKRCGDPTAKIIDHAGTLAKTVLEKAMELKTKEVESVAKVKEVEKEIIKAQAAKELMSQGVGPEDVDRLLDSVLRIVDKTMPLIEKIAKNR